jgi:hypothetical protein
MQQALIVAALSLFAWTVPAQAVVYCQYIGVPTGCVVRPGVVLHPAPGVGAPGVGAPGVGAPGLGARGVGVAPGPAGTANLGGPVNRPGVR